MKLKPEVREALKALVTLIEQKKYRLAATHLMENIYWGDLPDSNVIPRWYHFLSRAV